MPLFIKDVAGFFNVSENTIYRWINERRLPVHRVNQQHRFNRAELFEWATTTGTKISPGILLESETDSPPRVAEMLVEGGVFHGVEGDTKATALREIVNLMPLPKDVDRQFLWEVMLARESLGATGIGDGIAIPHVRSPIVLHLSKPIITLCFLKHAIDFKAIDGKPVTALFILVCPTVSLHLRLLSSLGFILMSPVLKAALARQASPEELIDIVRRVEAELPQAGTVTRAWLRLQQDLSCA